MPWWHPKNGWSRLLQHSTPMLPLPCAPCIPIYLLHSDLHSQHPITRHIFQGYGAQARSNIPQSSLSESDMLMLTRDAQPFFVLDRINLAAPSCWNLSFNLTNRMSIGVSYRVLAGLVILAAASSDAMSPNIAEQAQELAQTVSERDHCAWMWKGRWG